MDEIQQVVFELIVDILKKLQYKIQLRPETQSIAIDVKKRMRTIIYIRQRLFIYDQNSSKSYKIEFFEPDFKQRVLDTIQNIEQSNE